MLTWSPPLSSPSIQEDKHSGEVTITSVNRTHQLLADFRPMPVRMTAAGASSGSKTEGSRAQGGSGAVIPSAAASSSSAAVPELFVEELWRGGKELRGVMEAVGVPDNAMFTDKEVRG